MKRAIVLVMLITAGFAGGVLWMKQREAAPPARTEHPPAPAPAEAEATAPQVSRDTNGNAVVSMSDESQGDLGILVKSTVAFQMSPEQ